MVAQLPPPEAPCNRAPAPPPLAWQRSHLAVLPPAHSLVLRAGGVGGGGSGGGGPREVRFEVPLGHPGLAWLLEHRVAGRALLPAAAFLEVRVRVTLFSPFWVFIHLLVFYSPFWVFLTFWGFYTAHSPRYYNRD